MREEYPEGIVGDSYDKDVSNVSKILPPSLHTPNNDIRQNSHDQVQTPLREDHNPHLDTHQTNGIKKVILLQIVLKRIDLSIIIQKNFWICIKFWLFSFFSLRHTEMNIMPTLMP